MLISNGKFFKDNKTARVHRMSVIRILIKVPICTKLHEKPCYYFVMIYLKKKTRKVKTDEILSARAHYL